MLQRFRVARENDSGFTLIELLITIVILGVLAGVVVFAVATFSDDGKLVACKADKKNVEVAVEAYHAKNPNTWPADIAALVTAAYLKEVPSTTNGYSITYNNTTGAVGSTLANC